jgi:hypothetical protein
VRERERERERERAGKREREEHGCCDEEKIVKYSLVCEEIGLSTFKWAVMDGPLG